MCQEDNEEGVQTSEEDIEVYKVVEKSMYYGFDKVTTLFYNHKGNPGCSTLSSIIGSPYLFAFILTQKAIGFIEGYGYHSFPDHDSAHKYAVILMRDYGISNKRMFETKKLIIPKGTKFANGVISKEVIGGGLPSIRSEYLKDLQ